MATIEPTIKEQVRAALKHIPADDRDTWVRMGMACHSVSSEWDMFEVWDDWSRTSDSYDEKSAGYVWRSFKAGPVSVMSLFKTARDHGWQGRLETTTDPRVKTEEDRKRQEQMLSEKTQRRQAFEKWLNTAQQRMEDHPSPYLLRKGFKTEEAYTQTLPHAYEDELLTVVEYRNASTLQVTGAQIISADGTKRTVRGSSMSGVLDIYEDPEPPEAVVLCEGLATRVALQNALPAVDGLWICSVGSASNFYKTGFKVASKLNLIYSDKTLVFICDDDRQTKQWFDRDVGVSEYYALKVQSADNYRKCNIHVAVAMAPRPHLQHCGYDFADMFTTERDLAKEWIREILNKAGLVNI